MKRKVLLKHLKKCGCLLLREGANHSVFFNETKKKLSTVPRHNEINDILVRKICKDLEIDLP
jgi:mRNA interferase HicA